MSVSRQATMQTMRKQDKASGIIHVFSIVFQRSCLIVVNGNKCTEKHNSCSVVEEVSNL